MIHPYGIVKKNFAITKEELLEIREAFQTCFELVLGKKIELPDFTHLQAKMKADWNKSKKTYDKVSGHYVGLNKGKAIGKAICKAADRAIGKSKGKGTPAGRTKDQIRRSSDVKKRSFACPNCQQHVSSRDHMEVYFCQHISMPENWRCLEAAASSKASDVLSKRFKLWSHHRVLRRREPNNSFQGQWLQSSKLKRSSKRNFDFDFGLTDVKCPSNCFCANT